MVDGVRRKKKCIPYHWIALKGNESPYLLVLKFCQLLLSKSFSVCIPYLGSSVSLFFSLSLLHSSYKPNKKD